MILIACFVVAVEATYFSTWASLAGPPTTQPTSWLGFIDIGSIVRSLLLVGVAGTLGGFVAGRFRREKVGDDTKAGNGTKAGDATNAVAGLLGAYAIFLIIPGTFEVKTGELIKFGDLVKIIGLAAVGGFGGKAILTKVLNKALEGQVAQLGEQQKKQRVEIESANKAEKAAQRVLQDDEVVLEDPELAKIFKAAPSEVLGKIFYSAREQRKNAEAALLAGDGVGLNDTVMASEKTRNLHIKKIEATAKVFRALTQRDTEGVHHRTNAQLSYALAGCKDPKWKEAKNQIEEAIKKRDKKADTVGRYPIYEFHLACILIEIAKADAWKGLDQELISQLLSKAAVDHSELIRAALKRLDDLGGEIPKAETGAVDPYERYASLMHFAESQPAARELLEKLVADAAEREEPG